MATRSFIIRQSNNPDSPRYTGIYCHWDGYPQYVGVMLRDHYSHDGELQVLLGRGNISSLLTPGGRDMGGNDQQWNTYGEMAVQFEFLSDMLSHADGMGCEYAYVWIASTREWEYYDLRRLPQILDGVESVMELAKRPTEDDIRDVAIRATDALVKMGIIQDCTDTDDPTEFYVQDIIEAEVLAFAERFCNLTFEEE